MGHVKLLRTYKQDRYTDRQTRQSVGFPGWKGERMRREEDPYHWSPHLGAAFGSLGLSPLAVAPLVNDALRWVSTGPSEWLCTSHVGTSSSISTARTQNREHEVFRREEGDSSIDTLQSSYRSGLTLIAALTRLHRPLFLPLIGDEILALDSLVSTTHPETFSETNSARARSRRERERTNVSETMDHHHAVADAAHGRLPPSRTMEGGCGRADDTTLNCTRLTTKCRFHRASAVIFDTLLTWWRLNESSSYLWHLA